MLTLLALLCTAQAEDLVIDNETVVLGGVIEYDTVLVMNSGGIVVDGSLTIKADKFILQDSCTIYGTGKGYQAANPESGGPGPGIFGSDSGGGGAHGGNGGRGIRSDGVTADAFGGEAYGTVEQALDSGSAGGGSAAGAIGGHGGGVLIIEAAKIQLDGVVHLNGEGGSVNGGLAGGGGAGGGILLLTDELVCSGVLNARGGPGGKSGTAIGGGGGGGVILQYHDRPGRPCAVHVEGGAGGGTWSDGNLGTEYIGEIDFDGDGLTYAEGDCQSGIATAGPGAEEICNGIDDNCDGEVDEGDCAMDTGVDPTVPADLQWKLAGGTGWRCDSAAGGGLAGWLLLLPWIFRRRATNRA